MIIESLLVAISLCADCFAVSLCSSLTLKKFRWDNVLGISIAFAVIQTGFLLVGWLFGNLIEGLIFKISHIIGFLLLLYVGGTMLLEGLRNKQEARDLNGWKNIILAGVATSIDAIAVGIAKSMEGEDWNGMFPLLAAVFAITILSVTGGIWSGKMIGSRFGRWAEIAGGIILIAIGVSILIR